MDMECNNVMFAKVVVFIFGKGSFDTQILACFVLDIVW